MRKTLIALLLAASLPAAAMAMPDGGSRHHGEHGPRIFKELNLNTEQQQKVGKLMGEQMKAHREITRRYLDKLPAAEQKAMKDELTASRDKQQRELRALLTPEQQKTFDARQKKMQEQRAERAEFQKWKADKAKAQ